MSSITRISSGIGMPEPIDDHPLVAVDLAVDDAGEPGVQTGGVAHQRPHVVGTAADADLVADAPQCHDPQPNM